MPLVKLQNEPSQRIDIKDAAAIQWRATHSPNINDIAASIQEHFHDPTLTVEELYTGMNITRRAIAVSHGSSITIAFLGSDPRELYMNLWTDAKGLWFPYPVYENGNRVHSFYRDMWHGMREATYQALSKAVECMLARGITPAQVIVSGFSMGGGVSM
jgi:hypothetical protein